MPNFNTKELKVALAESLPSKQQKRLPGSAVRNMIIALEHCIQKEKDVTLVFCFLGHFLHEDDANNIYDLVQDDHESEVVVSHSDLLVIRTEGGATITVKLVGGPTKAGGEPKRKRKKQEQQKKELSADSEDSDDMDEGSLTQEVAGLFDMS